jgi:hypothetical protein
MEENSTDRPNVHQTNSLEVGRLETPGSFGGNLQSFLRRFSTGLFVYLGNVLQVGMSTQTHCDIYLGR